MTADVIENHVLRCKNVVWSSLDSNLKEINVSKLTVNAHSVTDILTDLVTNLNLVGKRFPFIRDTESCLSFVWKLVLEINSYKCHSISRTGRKGWGIKLFYLDCIQTEVISNFCLLDDSYESNFVNASIPGLGNLFVAEIYRPPNKPLTDFTQYITGPM